MLKKLLAGVTCAIAALTVAVGCNNSGGGGGGGTNLPPDNSIEATVTPIVYEVDAVKEISQTQAGTVDAWMGQMTNRAIAPDTLIESPYHTLEINGVNVPVYTARSRRGTHSFAWVDVAKTRRDWYMDIELTMPAEFGKCVVLPESTGVDVEIDQNVYSCRVTQLDTYTFTFAEDANADVTDPLLAPLTLMVTQENPLEIPEGYEVYEIEPGRYEGRELVLTEEFTAYVVKKGYHEVTGIEVPSNSILYIESGAYIKGIDQELGLAVIGGSGKENVQIISRGLVDCGDMSYDGNKHPFWFSRMNDFSVEGMTVLNANTWTLCFLDCTNFTVERNLLIGYRATSDGIMMSDCVNAVGRYNFVRTGDDGIEYKATGWGMGSNVGTQCVYEYNDCWTERVSAYGLIWENARDLDGVIFRNNSVGFAFANENEYLCPLEIRLGANAKAKWSNVLYENIELYYVDCGTVITVKVNSSDGGGLGGGGAIVDNISYKNITVKAVREGCVAFKMFFGENTEGDITNITVENMSFCGKTLTASDKTNSNYFVNEAGDKFNELTVK